MEDWVASRPAFFSRRTRSCCLPHQALAQDAHDGAAPLQLLRIVQHGSLNTSSGLYA